MPALGGAPTVFVSPVPGYGHEQWRSLGLTPGHLPRHLEAAQARPPQVQQDHVGLKALCLLQDGGLGLCSAIQNRVAATARRRGVQPATLPVDPEGLLRAPGIVPQWRRECQSWSSAGRRLLPNVPRPLRRVLVEFRQLSG
jgi:hypothetical protein